MEININKKICNIISLYRSPSQSHDQFEQFLQNFESNLRYITSKNSYITVVIGDFNARSTSWWTDDITTKEGTEIESLTLSYGLNQVINEQTHILPSSNSCIDLLFTSHTNMITESGVHSSLQICHVSFPSLNLTIGK